MASWLTRRKPSLALVVVCIAALTAWGYIRASAAPTMQVSSASASPTPTEYVSLGSPVADISTGEIRTGGYAVYSYILEVGPFVPFPTSTKTVKSIKLLAGDNGGTYGDQVYLRCEVRDIHGNVLRTVSLNDVDVESIPSETWIDIPLSSNPTDLTLGLGEYLAAYSYAGAGLGGSYYRYVYLVAELK